MPKFRIVRLGLAFIAALTIVPYLPEFSWAAEAFHPDGDARRRVEADDARSRERREEEPATRSREALRGQDITNQPRQEFHDARELEAIIRRESTGLRKLSEMDRVSSNRRADEISRRLGYEDAHQLKREFGADSRSDMFVDRGDNVYLGNKSGSGEPEFVGKLN